MGLTNIQKDLIMCIAQNNQKYVNFPNDIRIWALNALKEDKTEKNKGFVNRYVSMLEPQFMELPASLNGKLIKENVFLSFNENRYYVTEYLEKITDEILCMSKASAKLMALQVPYKNATLLYGPPGTGKTLFGRHIAYKMGGLPFYYVNFSNVVDSYMGSTSKNISRIFSFVKQEPCVLMLDEVDVISYNRDSDSGSSSGKENSRITVTLMQEFDMLPNDIVIIAATNRKDLLDEAFISRCSQVYEVTPFTKAENEKMIAQFLGDIQCSLSQELIDKIISEGKNQRTIMNEVIREVAKSLL